MRNVCVRVRVCVRVCLCVRASSHLCLKISLRFRAASLFLDF